MHTDSYLYPPPCLRHAGVCQQLCCMKRKLAHPLCIAAEQICSSIYVVDTTVRGPSRHSFPESYFPLCLLMFQPGNVSFTSLGRLHPLSWTPPNFLRRLLHFFFKHIALVEGIRYAHFFLATLETLFSAVSCVPCAARLAFAFYTSSHFH